MVFDKMGVPVAYQTRKIKDMLIKAFTTIKENVGSFEGAVLMTAKLNSITMHGLQYLTLSRSRYIYLANGLVMEKVPAMSCQGHCRSKQVVPDAYLHEKLPCRVSVFTMAYQTFTAIIACFKIITGRIY